MPGRSSVSLIAHAPTGSRDWMTLTNQLANLPYLARDAGLGDKQSFHRM